MKNPQQRAADTRNRNRENKKLYEEVSKPAHEKVEKVLNSLLLAQDIRLRFVGPWRLKGGVTGGRLMAIAFGGLELTVHIDGYKGVNKFASRFWEVA